VLIVLVEGEVEMFEMVFKGKQSMCCF